jgi:hypothetical protein
MRVTKKATEFREVEGCLGKFGGENFAYLVHLDKMQLDKTH